MRRWLIDRIGYSTTLCYERVDYSMKFEIFLVPSSAFAEILMSPDFTQVSRTPNIYCSQVVERGALFQGGSLSQGGSSHRTRNA